ncbi:hypothetical protein EON64_01365 [archaeon]|nr:MAG: hypothetical protein EON64_01365 [archaeon]
MRRELDARRIHSRHSVSRPKSSPANALSKRSRSESFELAIGGSSIELSVKKEHSLVWNQYADLAIASSYLGPSSSIEITVAEVKAQQQPELPRSSPKAARLVRICQALDQKQELPAEDDDLTVSVTGDFPSELKHEDPVQSPTAEVAGHIVMNETMLEEKEQETKREAIQVVSVFGSPNRFFMDLWLERHGSSSLDADPLNIELLLKLQRVEEVAKQRLFVDLESQLGEEACVLEYVKTVASSALEQLDVLISVLGSRFPLLKDIRKAFMPLISSDYTGNVLVTNYADETKSVSAESGGDEIIQENKENGQFVIHPYQLGADKLYLEQYHVLKKSYLSLQNESSALQEHCKHVELQLEQEKKKVDERNKRIQKLLDLKEEFTKNNKQLKVDLDKLSAECSSLKQQLAIETKLKQAANHTIQVFTKEKQSLELTLKETQLEVYTLDKQTKEQNSTITTLTRNLNEVKKDRKEMRMELSAIQDVNKKVLLDLNVDRKRFNEGLLRVVVSMINFSNGCMLNSYSGLVFDAQQVIDLKWDEMQLQKFIHTWLEYKEGEVHKMQKHIIDLNNNIQRLNNEKATLIKDNEEYVTLLKKEHKDEVSALQKSATEVASALRFKLKVKKQQLENEKQTSAQLSEKLAKSLESWNNMKMKLEVQLNNWIDKYDISVERREMLAEDLSQTVSAYISKLQHKDLVYLRDKQQWHAKLEDVKKKVRDIISEANREKEVSDKQIIEFTAQNSALEKQVSSLTVNLASKTEEATVASESFQMTTEDYDGKIMQLYGYFKQGRKGRAASMLQALISRSMTVIEVPEGVLQTFGSVIFEEENERSTSQIEHNNLNLTTGESFADSQMENNSLFSADDDSILMDPLERQSSVKRSKKSKKIRKVDTFYDQHYEPVKIEVIKNEESWQVLGERLQLEKRKLAELTKDYAVQRQKIAAELEHFNELFAVLQVELPKRLMSHVESVSTVILGELTMAEIMRRTSQINAPVSSVVVTSGVENMQTAALALSVKPFANARSSGSAAVSNPTVSPPTPTKLKSPSFSSISADAAKSSSASNLITSLTPIPTPPSLSPPAGLSKLLSSKNITDMDTRALIKLGKALNRRISHIHSHPVFDETDELEGMLSSSESEEEGGQGAEVEMDDWSGGDLGGSVSKREKIKIEFTGKTKVSCVFSKLCLPALECTHVCIPCFIAHCIYTQ